MRDNWYAYIAIVIDYTLFTSRQTKFSKGSVVNMLTPKQNRAMLMIKLSDGKLFRILPSN